MAGYDIQAGDQLQAPDVEQVYRSSGPYAASSAGNDSYAITVVPAVDTLVAGMVFRFKADVANTGACSLNVNSKGAKTIKKWGAGGKQDLSTGDIQADMFVTVQYDGTDMLLISAQQPRPLYAKGLTSKSSGSSTGTFTIAHGLGVTPRLIKITAVGSNSTNPANNVSIGSATSTSDETCLTFRSSGAPLSSSSNVIEHQGSDGTLRVAASVSALDGTNITLDFTTFNNQAQDLQIQWEAYA